MTFSTSRNLTILGIATILGALAAVAVALFDGDPATNPDWGVTLTAIVAGIGMILGKGAASTGGTVPETAEAKTRVG
jgi:hypothetical protein